MRAARIVGAILAGAVVAGLLVFSIEAASHAVYPPPADLDTSNREALAAYAESLPVGAKAFVLLAWFVATLAGAWVASRLARSPIAGFVIGALLLASGIANMVMIPHPVWFWVAAIAIFVATTFFATRLGTGRTSGRTA